MFFTIPLYYLDRRLCLFFSSHVARIGSIVLFIIMNYYVPAPSMFCTPVPFFG